MKDKLRDLPSVDKLLGDSHELVAEHGRERVRDVLRMTLNRAREAILAGQEVENDQFLSIAKEALMIDSVGNLKTVINCTGVIIHSNLGRSILAKEAVAALVKAASGPVNLEYDIEKGKRGERDDLVENLIKKLTGAEASTVVNNNAAAVFLALNTLSPGRETIVSRGELIEIGGSFRLPEIMRKSGCLLREVGATNRTHMSDYEEAVNEKTALILRAHTSNYQIVGFTSQPAYHELGAFAQARKIPFMVDLGSGALIDMKPLGLGEELTVAQTIATGADIVTFSADKLLGGPQAGVIAGSSRLIARIRKNHLKRALRCDKMTLAALEATLRIYLNQEAATQKIPALKAMKRPLEEVRAMANNVAQLLADFFTDTANVTVIDDICKAGSGSAPQADIPSVSVGIEHHTLTPDSLAEWFRNLHPPIVGRIEDDLFRLDMRIIEDTDEISKSLP